MLIFKKENLQASCTRKYQMQNQKYEQQETNITMDKVTRDALTVVFHVGIYIIPLGALFCFQCRLVLINSFVAFIYI